ncbi:MAG: class II aldolase/adducin family protein [Acidimicrobiales bacterium]|jgi:L-fuculose-phosphate aldolase
MQYEEARVEIARTGVRLEAEGLLSTTSGNISSWVGEGLIAITPTSIRYQEIRPEDVVITDLNGQVVDGERRPSSELPFHTTLYRSRADIGAVVHTHSTFATALAIMHRPIPAIHYNIAAFGVDEIPLVPYATFGSDELAANIEAIMNSGTGGALLANHGAVAVAAELQKAAKNAALLEFLATAYYHTLVLGGGVVLASAEIAHVIELYKTSGQPRSGRAGFAPVGG